LRIADRGITLPHHPSARVETLAVSTPRNRRLRRDFAGTPVMNLRTRAALLNVLLAAAVLAVLAGANVLASKSPLTWDLTRAGNNTLAPQSVLAAKHLTKDLDVIGLFVPGVGNGQS